MISAPPLPLHRYQFSLPLPLSVPFPVPLPVPLRLTLPLFFLSLSPPLPSLFLPSLSPSLFIAFILRSEHYLFLRSYFILTLFFSTRSLISYLSIPFSHLPSLTPSIYLRLIFLVQLQRGIDDLKRTLDRLRQREKQIIKDALQTEVKA